MPAILAGLLTRRYGFKGYVQSDCNAVKNEVNGSAGGRPRPGDGEHWAANATDAAARALVDGMMNSNCGGGLTDHVCDAIEAGLASNADLEARLTRSFTLLMRAGLFDPLEDQMYTKIPFETINSEASQASSLEAARQRCLNPLNHPCVRVCVRVRVCVPHPAEVPKPPQPSLCARVCPPSDTRPSCGGILPSAVLLVLKG